MSCGTAGWDWAGLRSRCLREASRVLPRPDAEEAVHEAFVRAWRRRDACRTPDSPLPWMLEITRNEAKRQLERRARRFSRELPEPAHAGEPEVEDDALAGANTRVTVQQALDSLGACDRRVLCLRYAEDLTQAEVARRLGVPEGTVKVRLHRARGRLRSLLEEPTATRSA